MRDLIDRANEFYAVREIVLDIALNGSVIAGEKVTCLEEYLEVVDSIDQSPDRSIDTIKEMFNLCSPRKATKRELIAYAEVYCIYALWPKELTEEIYDMKKGL